MDSNPSPRCHIETLRSHLPIILIGTGLIHGVLSLLYFYEVLESPNLGYVKLAQISSAVEILGGIALRFTVLPQRLVHPVAMCIAYFVLFNTVQHQLAMPHQDLSPQLSLIALGIASWFCSPRWFVFGISTIAAVWSWTLWTIGGAIWKFQIVYLVEALAFCVLIYLTRQKSRTLLLDSFSNLKTEIKQRARLESARAAAEEVAASQDRFISIASHELRTPIAAAQLQIHLLQRILRRQNVTPDSLRIVSESRAQIERLSQMVHVLLDVSRLNHEKIELSPEPVCLLTLVKNAIKQFQPELTGTGRTVQVRANAAPVIECDSLRIHQVLSNLISNALKYGGNEAVNIEVWADADHVGCTVQDRGKGISKQDQERIFRPFERAARDGQVQGLGLGLYIARLVAKAHGGEIRVESTLGAGSSFTVSLPRPQASDGAIAS